LLVFLVECTAIHRIVLPGSRLHGQFAHALQVAADGGKAGFGGLRGGNAVVGVTHGNRHAARLGEHVFGNRETRGVVLGAVDAQAGRQALQSGVQIVL
jgi:hypothetical protein